MLSKLLNDKANEELVDTATSTKKHVEEEIPTTVGRIKRKIKRNLADYENEYNQSNNEDSESDLPQIQASDGSDDDFVIEKKPKKGKK